MKIEFDAKLSAKDLFLFNVLQAYKGLQGIVSLVLPAIIFGYTFICKDEVDDRTFVVNIVLGLVFLLYIPVTLWLRANKVVKMDPVLSKPLHYEFGEEQICVSQGAEKAEFEWDNIYRMRTFGGLVLIYTNRIHAYIINKNQIVDEYAPLKELAQKKLVKYRIKMK